jgi:DNA repair protein RadC
LGVKDLMTIKGVGKAKAVTLTAALELGRRRQSTPPLPATPITSTEDVVHFLQPLLKDHSFEVVIVLFLNQANVVKHVEWISKGGLDRAIIDVRIIVRKALEEFCSAIILCHNHPSGSLKPSKADIFSTAKVQKAAAAFDIQLLDHLIVSEQGYFSFANEGYITPL